MSTRTRLRQVTAETKSENYKVDVHVNNWLEKMKEREEKRKAEEREREEKKKEEERKQKIQEEKREQIKQKEEREQKRKHEERAKKMQEIQKGIEKETTKNRTKENPNEMIPRLQKAVNSIKTGLSSTFRLKTKELLSTQKG